MRWIQYAVIASILGGVAASCVQAQRPQPLPASSLAVRDGDVWLTIWKSDRAPVVWRDSNLVRHIAWRRGLAGMQWGDVAIAGSGEAWRTRVIVVRFRPDSVMLRLDTAFAKNAPDWSLAHLPSNALFAVNAGQFAATMPWGWTVLDGRQWLAPQRGPLAAVLAQDASGVLHWIRDADVASFAATRPKLRWAFQSYPVLLQSDTVPPALRAPGRGLDVSHRDARAAICLDRGGRVVVALTRFDAMGAPAGFIPFGLTTPEMAAVMGALGCRDAMLLDGGISAQLRVRDRHGIHDWRGVRKVPLALVALPR